MLDRINLQINLEWTRAQDYEWIILAGKFNNYDREGFRVALQKRKGKGVGEHLLLGISFLGFHVYQRLKGAYISGKEHAFKASNYWGRCVMGTINYCETRNGGKNETVLRTVNWDLDIKGTRLMPNRSLSLDPVLSLTGGAAFPRIFSRTIIFAGEI